MLSINVEWYDTTSIDGVASNQANGNELLRAIEYVCWTLDLIVQFIFDELARLQTKCFRFLYVRIFIDVHRLGF